MPGPRVALAARGPGRLETRAHRRGTEPGGRVDGAQPTSTSVSLVKLYLAGAGRRAVDGQAHREEVRAYSTLDWYVRPLCGCTGDQVSAQFFRLNATQCAASRRRFVHGALVNTRTQALSFVAVRACAPPASTRSRFSLW